MKNMDPVKKDLLIIIAGMISGILGFVSIGYSFLIFISIGAILMALGIIGLKKHWR